LKNGGAYIYIWTPDISHLFTLFQTDFVSLFKNQLQSFSHTCIFILFSLV